MIPKISNNETYAKRYLTPLITHGSKHYINNAKTTPMIFSIDKHEFPGGINDTEYDSSYVCSIYNALISYGSEESHKIGNPWIERPLRALMALQSALLRFGQINKNIFVNNYLLSTNLYPKWNGEGLNDFTQSHIKDYPDHAIIFRSLNHHTNARQLEQFEKRGYQLIPTRQVYIFDAALNNFNKRRNVMRDKQLLEDSNYDVIEPEAITAAQYPRIVELYNLLYLEKYSKHNPQYNEHMIAHWHKNNLLNIRLLKAPNGRIDGVIGCFENSQLTSAPLVGYNTSLPQEVGLYRMLIYLILKHTNDQNKILNLSSGAPEFKRTRGAQPFIEYAAIYIKHLPLKRRVIWRLVNLALSYLFVPLLKKYKL